MMEIFQRANYMLILHPGRLLKRSVGKGVQSGTDRRVTRQRCRERAGALYAQPEEEETLGLWSRTADAAGPEVGISGLALISYKGLGKCFRQVTLSNVRELIQKNSPIAGRCVLNF